MQIFAATNTSLVIILEKENPLPTGSYWVINILGFL